MAFRGHYEHSLDAKHRLSIPSRFRTAFSSGLVLAKDTDACISAWTPEAHEATVERALAGRNPFGREYRGLQRYFQANSFDMELDSSGRVTLPPPPAAGFRSRGGIAASRPGSRGRGRVLVGRGVAEWAVVGYSGDMYRSGGAPPTPPLRFK